ncbi:MAG: hypothetical protein N2606_03605 [Candidatus Omnitrophica bacterium]|nr:hypothetical protein [Candidatus Omnitrophota bacterium]
MIKKQIKKLRLTIILLIMCISLEGCKTIEKITQPPQENQELLEVSSISPYNGPKVSVVIGNFDIKTPLVNEEMAQGLKEMFISALINTQRFIIEEKFPQESNKSPSKASILIAVTIEDFLPQSSSGSSGIGGGGGVGSGLLGGFLDEALSRARLTITLRLVELATQQVIASTRLQGQAQDAAGAYLGSYFGGWGLGKGLNVYANTPMEKAIRLCLIEAVRFVSERIPHKYYQ